MIKKEKFLKRLEQITFNEDITPIVRIDNVATPKQSNELSWRITDFPSKEELKVMQYVNGMSTAANCYLINEICRELTKDEIYVNIGVWKGMTLIAGYINTICKIIGVDNFSQFGGPKKEFEKNYNKYKRDNSEFYEQDYVNFFNKYNRYIDFYFYDGEHSYEIQYQAIELVIPFLKTGSLIMIDDTNGNNPRSGTLNALYDNDRQYDIWLDQRTAHNCHPTYWNGIIILEIL